MSIQKKIDELLENRKIIVSYKLFDMLIQKNDFTVFQLWWWHTFAEVRKFKNWPHWKEFFKNKIDWIIKDNNFDALFFILNLIFKDEEIN